MDNGIRRDVKGRVLNPGDVVVVIVRENAGKIGEYIGPKPVGGRIRRHDGTVDASGPNHCILKGSFTHIAGGFGLTRFTACGSCLQKIDDDDGTDRQVHRGADKPQRQTRLDRESA